MWRLEILTEMIRCNRCGMLICQKNVHEYVILCTIYLFFV